MGGRTVTLPRRGVEDDGALIGDEGERTRVIVGLRAADLDRARVEVVVPQHATQALACRVTRDQGVVVGLELVGRHVHLVGLAVVDEHVPAATVAEHLEVAGVLVDIQDDADVMLGDRLLEVAHGRRVHDRERTVAQQCARPRGVSGQHDDGPGLREVGEWSVPLSDLVHVDLTVGEVDRDRVAPRCHRPLLSEREAHLTDGGTGAQRPPRESETLARVGEDSHPSSLDGHAAGPRGGARAVRGGMT